MNPRNLMYLAIAVVVVLAVIDGAGRKLAPSPGVTGALAGEAADNVTMEGWADALLETLGMPSTSANLGVVEAWMRQENGRWEPPFDPDNGARFNPLNATQPEGGSKAAKCLNATCTIAVQAYTSWDYGLQATVDTLRAGNHGYPAILTALGRGNDAAGVRDAVVRSDWGTKWFPV